MKLLGIHWWREKPRVIGERAAWCAAYGCWGHYCSSPIELLWSVVTEWKNDRHLVG